MKREEREKAQDFVLNHLAIIGYGESWEKLTDEETKNIKVLMDRIARQYGYEKSWFY